MLALERRAAPEQDTGVHVHGDRAILAEPEHERAVAIEERRLAFLDRRELAAAAALDLRGLRRAREHAVELPFHVALLDVDGAQDAMRVVGRDVIEHELLLGDDKTAARGRERRRRAA